MHARLYLLSTVSALALAGNLALASHAFAADMPVKAPPPVVVAAPSWTGFYIGGHGGVGWLRHDQTYTGTSLQSCAFGVGITCGLRETGAVFGGQAGYNLQLQQWVVGIEADASGTTLKKSVTFPILNAEPHIINAKVDWLASVRGRLGVAVNDWLFYGTGGVAFAKFKAGWLQPPSTFNDQIDKTKTGWVAGGGIEKLLNRNWSARAEFLHYDFGRTSHTVNVGIGTYTTAFRHNVSVVRLGINYRPNP